MGRCGSRKESGERKAGVEVTVEGEAATATVVVVRPWRSLFMLLPIMSVPTPVCD